MKHKILLFALSIACLLPAAVNAQPAKDNQEQQRRKWEDFREAKHTFYAEKLELTEAQAKEFFALYDEMEQKKFELSRDMRRTIRTTMKKGAQVSDEEYKAVADEAADLSTRLAAIEKEYYAKFCQILSPKQQFLYHRCEIGFRKYMLQKNKGHKRK